MNYKFTIDAAKITVWGALGFALVCHLWAANRGLEMMDEPSYYLLALNPWHTMGHGSLHGFILHPLFLLSGQSVAGLRITGFLLTLVVAGRLAFSLSSYLNRGSKQAASPWLCLMTPVLMISSLTYGNAGARSPCYNWLVLIGAMLVWSGWFRFVAARRGALEVALGLFFIFTGKWSSWIVFTPWMLAVLLLAGPKDGRVRFGVVAGTATVLLTGGFLVFFVGLDALKSTWETGRIFQDTTRTHGFYLLPKYAWEILYYCYRVARAYVWLLPGVLLFWWLAWRQPLRWPIGKIGTILFMAGFFLAAARGWWRGGYDQFGKESVLAGCWLLGVVWTTRQRAEGGGQKTKLGGRGSVVDIPASVLCALVLTPFLLGFGTATSIADYAGQGTVFLTAAGCLALARVPSKGSGKKFPLAIVALTGLGLIQASRVSSSLLDLSRIGSIWNQNARLTFGPEKERFFVDANLARAVQDVGQGLVLTGYQPGDPIIAVDGLCGLVYLLGAQSPEACWFFENQEQYLRRMVARIRPEKLRRCWVLQRSTAQIVPVEKWHPDPGAVLFRERVPVTLDRGPEQIRIYAPKGAEGER